MLGTNIQQFLHTKQYISYLQFIFLVVQLLYFITNLEK